MSGELETLQDSLPRWLEKSREGVQRWIAASGISWTDLGIATGAPPHRVRYINFTSVEMEIVAERIQKMRPLPFEYEIEDLIHQGKLLEVRPEVQRIMAESLKGLPDDYERMVQRIDHAEAVITLIHEFRRPLTERWAEVDFIAPPDQREKQCYRCGNRWQARTPHDPAACPRCRSPRWNDATILEVTKAECLRCGKVWRTKVARPLRCPKCQRPDWDRVESAPSGR